MRELGIEILIPRERRFRSFIVVAIFCTGRFFCFSFFKRERGREGSGANRLMNWISLFLSQEGYFSVEANYWTFFPPDLLRLRRPWVKISDKHKSLPGEIYPEKLRIIEQQYLFEQDKGHFFPREYIKWGKVINHPLDCRHTRQCKWLRNQPWSTN